MDNKKLDTLRGNINSLDDKILDLLKQRAEIVTEIGEQKKSKTNIVDIEREKKVLDRLLQNSKIKYSKDSIVRIWREIFQASAKLQENNRTLINTKRSINSINVYNSVFLDHPTGDLRADKMDYNFETKYFKVSMFDDKAIKMKVIQ